MHKIIIALIWSALLMVVFFTLRYFTQQVRSALKLEAQAGNDVIDILSQSEPTFITLSEITSQMGAGKTYARFKPKTLEFYVKTLCRSLETAGAIQRNPCESELSYKVLFFAKQKWKQYLDLQGKMRK